MRRSSQHVFACVCKASLLLKRATKTLVSMSALFSIQDIVDACGKVGVPGFHRVVGEIPNWVAVSYRIGHFFYFYDLHEGLSAALYDEFVIAVVDVV